MVQKAMYNNGLTPGTPAVKGNLNMTKVEVAVWSVEQDAQLGSNPFGQWWPFLLAILLLLCAICLVAAIFMRKDASKRSVPQTDFEIQKPYGGAESRCDSPEAEPMLDKSDGSAGG